MTQEQPDGRDAESKAGVAGGRSAELSRSPSASLSLNLHQPSLFEFL